MYLDYGGDEEQEDVPDRYSGECNLPVVARKKGQQDRGNGKDQRHKEGSPPLPDGVGVAQV